MSKRTITRTFISSLVAFVAGLVLLVGAVALVYARNGFVMDGLDVVGVRGSAFSWSLLALAGLAVLVTLGGLVGQFVAWIGAVINTSQLADKTWFLVLLVLGVLSFGLVAMVVYIVAGPDDPPRPIVVTPRQHERTSAVS